MAALLSAVERDAKLVKLREVAHNCPACILAALRQSGIQQFDGEGAPFEPDFNFKSERDSVFSEYNVAVLEREYPGY
jgi:hypothetical protein